MSGQKENGRMNGETAQQFLARRSENGQPNAFEFVDYIPGQRRGRAEVRLPGERFPRHGSVTVNGQGVAGEVFHALNEALPVTVPHRHLLHGVYQVNETWMDDKVRVELTRRDGNNVVSEGESVPHVVSDAVQVVLLERTG